ncbi:amidohydrolase [Sphingomonas sp. Root710]|uniref:N-acyl-D-amino-acid deacylase family protein n=1 Tax=Sphingomonas sp. Root710 TaxID=1736594 RepID=UPI0006FBC75C|nr:amidohydrolase family protein [Sphingomonas sp. Root710]KRB83014.1 amidohydrolase [Sphingomonas sp. Root710]
MAQAQFDLVIRGGMIADGTGREMFAGDVAVRDRCIVAVGQVSGSGVEELDARDRVVTPGFVDIHTHYDGQITWENRLAPSSDHGVTTAVMGNCGVGFAPCRAEDRERLISVMEGVEDIPEIVMSTGLPWTWETYPQYLDFIGQRPSDVDFASYVPHSAVRVYVMGERGAALEPPTDADLSAMTDIVAEGIRAGAIGVSTSRSLAHKRSDGVLCPSVPSELRELEALAQGLARTGKGIFQIIPNNMADPDEEFSWIRRLQQVSGRPVSFSLMDWPHKPGDSDRFLALMDELGNDVPISAQVAPRPIGGLYGLDLSYHPFLNTPSFQPLRNLPVGKKVAAMRDPDLRRRMVDEAPNHSGPFLASCIEKLDVIYEMTTPAVYDPDPRQSIAARAARMGFSPLELVYDLMVASGGKAIFYFPAANYRDARLDSVRKMMTHARGVPGLGDGGAHYGIVCDASFPTFMLSYWTKDAAPSQRLPVEWVVSRLSGLTARTVGMTDRGLIAPGMKADINIIDFDALELSSPETVHDLPAGGRRLRQKVKGFDATIVSGQITYRHGEATGALPGRLVRAA